MNRWQQFALLLVAIASGCAPATPERPPLAPSGPAAAPVTVPTARPSATLVGGERCTECHAAQGELWRGSDHDLAMQPAEPGTVLGDFDDARFTYGGVTSRFFRRNGDFWVETDGADGALTEYAITYTFGVDPLQQYLIDVGSGRLQALGIAWDSRSSADGGQRWFHLYPGEAVDHRDVLHWTRPSQNWNHMCAECHSTRLRKGYEPESDRFETTWAEIDVSCEACHGPGSNHVIWAEAAARGEVSSDDSLGLVVQLDPRKDTIWVLPADQTSARLEGQPNSVQVETCGRCHSRRALIDEDYRHGRSLSQTHRVSLLREDLYHPDGQIRDEVYVYGSFLQSKMFGLGVVCSDCHDPHSGRLRAEGNTTCARCHQPAVFDVVEHHGHALGTEAALCVTCHMPETTYMVVDPRRDHGMKVPRPELSATIGAPDVCGRCHADQGVSWSARAIAGWREDAPATKRFPWERAIAAGRRRSAGADRLLAELIGAPEVPAIVRATALDLIGRWPGPTAGAAIEGALADREPLVRRAAIGALASFEPAVRGRLAVPALQDPQLAVRMEAVNVVADVVASLPPPGPQLLDSAADEYRAVQLTNADRADALLNLGGLEARLGNAVAAEVTYRLAIERQPDFLPSYVNLADLYRALGRDAEGEALLREALKRAPSAGDLRHALGLLLVRQDRKTEALAEFAAAVEARPDRSRYVVVLAVALQDQDRLGEAIDVLRAAHERMPGDRQILSLLVPFERQAGHADEAARWLELLRSEE